MNKDEQILGMIQTIREENNVCWMDLLRLALRHAPEEARDLMKRVYEYDRQISELMKELCESNMV